MDHINTFRTGLRSVDPRSNYGRRPRMGRRDQTSLHCERSSERGAQHESQIRSPYAFLSAIQQVSHLTRQVRRCQQRSFGLRQHDGEEEWYDQLET